MQRSSQGPSQRLSPPVAPSMARSSDAGTFLCPCSDPVRIRQIRTLAGEPARLPSLPTASLHLSHRTGYFLWKTDVERSD